ncbi:hypothetical protein GQ457_10G014670 [Hibiscus cannabinus]
MVCIKQGKYGRHFDIKMRGFHGLVSSGVDLQCLVLFCFLACNFRQIAHKKLHGKGSRIAATIVSLIEYDIHMKLSGSVRLPVHSSTLAAEWGIV